MDFNKVGVFVRIVEAGGLTAAARRLNLPKSSVSRVLKQLEAEVGAQLIVRDPRQQRLTDAGRALFETAASAFAAVEHAGEQIRDAQHGMHGLIRVAAHGYLGTAVVLPSIRAFEEAHPDVQIDFTVTGRDIEPVRDGYDIVVRDGPLADSPVVARPLLRAEWGVFASRGYLARRGVPQTPADLPAHDWIQCQSTMASTHWLLKGPHGVESLTVRAVFHVDETLELVAMALADAGIILLPIEVPARDPSMATLERVLPEYSMSGPTVYVLFAGAARAPRRVAMLVEAITEDLCRRFPAEALPSAVGHAAKCNGAHPARASAAANGRASGFAHARARGDDDRGDIRTRAH